ncbi:RHS repeat protein [Enterovibrio sp. ZSDZ42]|uniref:RHS repeat protein n=1 Tax=Enterovibrio gelatinilyticus TaxID=2899819 RepID=A0ABT5RA70_9GAMM|nr:RHS repeat domain-containing protein [Enterovibrio sp. ZSDZ42]MDD1796407.1 RHS repeat protein [Enterovibrio sp. ZSDZ42]
MEKPDGSKASYQYDAFGRRISKSITDRAGNTSSTDFI